jgi:hypothetical protein
MFERRGCIPFAAESESDLLHVFLLLFAGTGSWGSHGWVCGEKLEFFSVAGCMVIGMTVRKVCE